MIDFASSPIVNLTLWVLIGFSVIVWAIILLKSWEQWRLQRANRAYAKAFWSAPSLAAAAELSGMPAPLARIAKAGFDVLNDTHADNAPASSPAAIARASWSVASASTFNRNATSSSRA